MSNHSAMKFNLDTMQKEYLNAPLNRSSLGTWNCSEKKNSTHHTYCSMKIHFVTHHNRILSGKVSHTVQKTVPVANPHSSSNWSHSTKRGFGYLLTPSLIVHVMGATRCLVFMF